MKILERIFLYSVIAIMAFHLFLVDSKVESQVTVQEEIRAKRISIVNDAGKEVVWLGASKKGDGGLFIRNKDGASVVNTLVSESGGGTVTVSNKTGYPIVTMITDEKGDGGVFIRNQDDSYSVGMSVGKTSGGVLIYHKTEYPIIVINASDEEGGFIGISDNIGNAIVGIGENDKGNGEIAVFNKNGKVLGSIP